jgi:hypothetical protein
VKPAHLAGPNSFVVQPCISDMNIESFLASLTTKSEINLCALKRSKNPQQLDLKVLVTVSDTQERIEAKTLLDSGAQRSVIDEHFVQARQIPRLEAAVAIPVYNADHSLNGYIKECVELVVTVLDHLGKEHSEILQLPIVNLGGKHDLFLGFDWLNNHNPSVDWKNLTLNFNRCPKECGGAGVYVRSLSTETGFHLPAQYRDFALLFEKEEFDKLPARKPWDHEIKLKPGAENDRRLKGKIYPLSSKEQVALDEWLKEEKRAGKIRDSQSPYGAPFFFVKKGDGSLRPVMDYRRLNEQTVRDSYPLPLITDMMAKIKKSKIFTKLDVRWGYNNVRIKEGDEHKAAFITNRGLFEPLVMYFGLTNSPATFQALMNRIFEDLINKDVTIVIMDDVLICTETMEQHRKVVREVLKRFKENDLYLKAEKCVFEAKEVKFMGMIVREGEVSMDPAKVQAVQEWPEPKNVTAVRSFLGFCNFYRAFINRFSDLAAPLVNLTKKNVKFVFGDVERKAMNGLKRAIAEDVTLAFPDPEKRFRLETDASNIAIGGVLHQDFDGKPRPVGFFSQTFNSAERNYPVYDKEMTGIMRGLEHWRQYLRNGEEFDIHTDHKNIAYFREPQKLNMRQAGWMAKLADYNFKLHYKPGRLNHIADALSRKDESPGDEEPPVTLLPPEVFVRAIVIPEDHDDIALPVWIDRIGFQDEEEILRLVRNARQKWDPSVESQKGWKETNGIGQKDGMIYVPNDKVLRDRIVYMHHDSPIAGHPGIDKTTELITRTYWWPRIADWVRKYVGACDKCQRNKPRHGSLHAPSHPLQRPNKPWESIGVDLVGPLPLSKGKDTIVTFVDRFSKMVVFAAVTKNVSSEELAQIFHDKVWIWHGLPLEVTSDRGPQFVSEFMRALYKRLRIEGNPSTAYHPQTNGQTERMNAEVELYLKHWVNDKQDDWADWVGAAQFALNNRVASATKVSPFFMVYGRHPRIIPGAVSSGINEAADTFAKRMEDAWKKAREGLDLAASIMK